ncbi:MAG TPA: hypothetical protein VFC30_01985 [Solirubrobacteraceae bacterium]|nr:hypothetical protein [Solirubrobacteraceae bacterium]
MYHLELRQFPHNVCRFNLTERELLETVVEGWAREQWIEVGERKWNPHQAKLTVLEGPHLPIEQLSMGRGWRNAQRESEDVTERLLAQVRQADEAAKARDAAASGSPAPAGGFAEQLNLLLGADPAALLQAWGLAAERRPELAPSESLALAEETLRSLDGNPSLPPR